MRAELQEAGLSIEPGEDRRRVELEEGRVDVSQIRGGESGLEIRPVLDELNGAVEQAKRVDKLLRIEWEPRVALAIDRALPARLLLQLMYTTGQAGLFEYELWGRGPAGERGAMHHSPQTFFHSHGGQRRPSPNSNSVSNRR